MADSKFRIAIETLLNNRGIRAGIAGLRGTVTMAKRAGRAIGKIWNVKPVLYFRRAVVAAFAAIGIGGVKSAADMESLRTQLEAVLGDAEKAKKAFDESFDFSVATPFSPEDIVKTRIALESVGVTGKDAVSDVATAAAAMGRNILDVASAVRSMETEPLRNLGIMLKRDGEKFVFEYKDKMRQARTVTANGFAQAQQTLLGILGNRFEGGLEKMSQTFKGLWSTLLGNLKASLADFGEQYLPSVKKGVQSVIDALNGLRESGKLKEWGKAVNDTLLKTAKTIRGFVEYFRIDAPKAMKESMAALKEVFVGLFQAGAEKMLEILARAFPALGRVLGTAAKNAWKGKDEPRERAESGARFRAKTKARRRVEDEMGPYNDTLGQLDPENRRRRHREKEIQGQLYKQYLPGFLEEEYAREGERSVAGLPKSYGLDRARGGVEVLKGQAAVGNERKDSRNETFRADMDALRAKAGKHILAKEQGDVFVASHKVNAAQASGDPGALNDALKALANERKQATEVGKKIQDMASQSIATQVAILESLAREASVSESIRREIDQLRNQIRNNRG